MEKDKDEIWRRKIESQLSQIKFMLIILIDICILGFYGLSRVGWDDIAGEMTDIAEKVLIIALIANVLLIIAWAGSFAASNKKESDEIKKISDSD